MKLGYVILYVSDINATVEFYQHAFNIEARFIHETGQYAEMETGLTALAFALEELTSTHGMFQPNRLEQKPAGAEIAFITDNVQQSYDQAIEAGATAVLPPERKPWGQTISYVRDNNGFLVEICSKVTP